MTNSKKEYLQIGRIIKPHGYRGDVTIRLEKEFVGIFDVVDIIYSKSGVTFVPIFIENVDSKNKGHYKVTIEDMETEAEAKSMSGIDIYVDARIANEFNPNHGDDQRLTGFQVIDKSWGEIGVIQQITDYGGSPVLEISSINGENQIIPMHDNFIVSIDEKKKVVLLSLPEGLLDLNN